MSAKCGSRHAPLEVVRLDWPVVWTECLRCGATMGLPGEFLDDYPILNGPPAEVTNWPTWPDMENCYWWSETRPEWSIDWTRNRVETP